MAGLAHSDLSCNNVLLDRATIFSGDDCIGITSETMPISNITIQGQLWMTVEHYFQGMKTLDPQVRERIRMAPTPGKAKALGRGCRLRANWEEIKIPVMRMALRNKFLPTNSDGRYLLNTGNALLLEGNDWGDKYWGVVNGQGENWLGHLLMARRAEIRYLEAA